MRLVWAMALACAVGCGRTGLGDNRNNAPGDPAGDPDTTTPLSCPAGCDFSERCEGGVCVAMSATWQALGDSGTLPGIAAGLTAIDSTALAVDATGAPLVATSVSTGGQQQPYVYRFDGQSWTPLGGGPVAAFSAAYVQIKVAADGTVYTAWQDGDHGLRVYSWDGAQWQAVGASDVGNGVNDTASEIGNNPLALGSDGSVYLGFTRYSAGVGTICLYVFNGSTWGPYPGTEANGVSGTTSWGASPAIAIANDGYPIVAWDFSSVQKPGVFDDHDHTYVRRYDGSSWIELDGSATDYGISVGHNDSWNPQVVPLAGAQFAVTWYELDDGSDTLWRTYVRQWTGDSWQALAESATAPGLGGANPAENPKMVADSEGRIIITFTSETASGADAYVKAWNGSVWEELAGSASSGGVSHLAGFAYNSDVALTPDGNILAAWAWSYSNPDATFGAFVRELVLSPAPP